MLRVPQVDAKLICNALDIPGFARGTAPSVACVDEAMYVMTFWVTKWSALKDRVVLL